MSGRPRFFFTVSAPIYTGASAPAKRRPDSVGAVYSGAQTVYGRRDSFFLNIHFRRLETRVLGLTAGVGAGWAAS